MGFATPDVLVALEKFVRVLQSSQPWDAPARSWDEFWGLRVSGVAVYADRATGQIRNVQPVINAEEGSFTLPESREQWTERLRCNLMYYRQNYLSNAFKLALVLAFSSPWRIPLLLTALGIFGGMLVSSDRMLQEFSLRVEEYRRINGDGASGSGGAGRREAAAAGDAGGTVPPLGGALPAQAALIPAGKAGANGAGAGAAQAGGKAAAAATSYPSSPVVFNWNQTRAFGQDRGVLRRWLFGASAFLALLLPGPTLDVVRGTVLWGALGALTHASLRPVQLLSSASAILTDLKNAKNGQEVTDAVVKGWGMMRAAAEDALRTQGRNWRRAQETAAEVNTTAQSLWAATEEARRQAAAEANQAANKLLSPPKDAGKGSGSGA